VTDLARMSVSDDDGLRVVELAGEVDASNVGQLREAALDGLPNSAHGVVVDMRELTYVDSAGIAFLFDAAERLAVRGQTLALVVAPGAVIRRALEVTRIDDLAPVHGSVEAARAHLLPSDGEPAA
jgi:anti-sigma B factor antagonist